MPRLCSVAPAGAISDSITVSVTALSNADTYTVARADLRSGYEAKQHKLYLRHYALHHRWRPAAMAMRHWV